MKNESGEQGQYTVNNQRPQDAKPHGSATKIVGVEREVSLLRTRFRQRAATLRRPPCGASGSVELGRKVAALLDSESPVDAVTAGKVTPAMKAVGAPTRTGGGQITGSDLEVTARWGIAGKGGVTMPGAGKTTARPFTDDERAALGDDAVSRLGPDTLDVYLNAVAYWKNVPRRVWEYQLGGYQVLKKWLSYRAAALLGRALTVDEVAHVRDTVRRIAALLLLGPALDDNYAAVTAAPFAWPPPA